ncbi:hypothetical protein ABIB06_007600 [Bradyrhizobium sp. LB8.2]
MALTQCGAIGLIGLLSGVMVGVPAIARVLQLWLGLCGSPSEWP